MKLGPGHRESDPRAQALDQDTTLPVFQVWFFMKTNWICSVQCQRHDLFTLQWDEDPLRSEEGILILVNWTHCKTVKARGNDQCVPRLQTVIQCLGKAQGMVTRQTNSSRGEWEYPCPGRGEGCHGSPGHGCLGPGACQEPRLLGDVHPMAFLDHRALILPWNILFCLKARLPIPSLGYQWAP